MFALDFDGYLSIINLNAETFYKFSYYTGVDHYFDGYVFLSQDLTNKYKYY